MADREVGKAVPLNWHCHGMGHAESINSAHPGRKSGRDVGSNSRCFYLFLKAGFRSIMLIPLISKDQVIGTLALQTAKQNAYTEVELKLAERISNQIAGAIANAQLFIERKRAEEALQRVRRSKAASSRECDHGRDWANHQLHPEHRRSI